MEIREFLEQILEAVRALDAKVDAVDAKVDAVDAKVTEDREVIRLLSAQMVELEEKFDGIRNDLAMVKGGHARNAMRQNLSRIADEFGFRFIAEMPQQAVIEFSKVAAGRGIGQGETESFRNADMVVHVRDDKGNPGYLAIEASFTVDNNDVRRANRNAQFLRQYTGLPSYGAVAGVEVLPDVQRYIDKGDVLFYSIRPRELQSE